MGKSVGGVSVRRKNIIQQSQTETKQATHYKRTATEATKMFSSLYKSSQKNALDFFCYLFFSAFNTSLTDLPLLIFIIAFIFFGLFGFFRVQIQSNGIPVTTNGCTKCLAEFFGFRTAEPKKNSRVVRKINSEQSNEICSENMQPHNRTHFSTHLSLKVTRAHSFTRTISLSHLPAHTHTPLSKLLTFYM